MTPTLGLLLAYVVLQLGLGVYVSRKIKNEDDYLVAGRSLGPLLATASVFATWFGAETCVGAAGQVYEHGPAAVSADPFGYGVCLVLMGLLLAGPLWKRSVVTLADLFARRYSRSVERTVAILLIPGSLLWAAAQIKAFGTVVSAAGGFSAELGMLVAVIAVLVYTSTGGMLADAWTDALQGAVLVITLLVLLFVAMPDVPALVEHWPASDATEGPGGSGVWTTVNDWAIPVVGSLFSQELLMRVSAANSGRQARRSSIAAGFIYLVVGAIPVVLGLLGRTLVPGIDEADAVLPAVTRHYLGEIGFVVLSGALLSAIFSTVDSALLACGSLVAHNLLPPSLRERSPSAPLELARLSVVLLGIAAWGLAHGSDGVHELVQESSAFGSTGLFVIGVMALGPRLGGSAAAFAALGGGLVSWMWLAHVEHSPVAYLGSLVCAAGGYGVAAWIERRRGGPPAEDPDRGRSDDEPADEGP